MWRRAPFWWLDQIFSWLWLELLEKEAVEPSSSHFLLPSPSSLLSRDCLVTPVCRSGGEVCVSNWQNKWSGGEVSHVNHIVFQMDKTFAQKNNLAEEAELWMEDGAGLDALVREAEQLQRLQQRMSPGIERLICVNLQYFGFIHKRPGDGVSSSGLRPFSRIRFCPGTPRNG